MTAVPALDRAVGYRGENVTSTNATLWDARRRTVRRVSTAQRERRREYEQRLREDDVPAPRRRDLLAEMAADHRERVREIERGFEVVGVRMVEVP
ncbi:hypothetical protein BRC81_13775 [Halobacteriales archaeon QS_1_68_20]|nr:MAG: hypothetical protein BRC81_13775 [Halobacteriales archaeon QS_1_68_20]